MHQQTLCTRIKGLSRRDRGNNPLEFNVRQCFQHMSVFAQKMFFEENTLPALKKIIFFPIIILLYSRQESHKPTSQTFRAASDREAAGVGDK